VGQGSALSPILSALYLAPVLWKFHTERHNAQLISYVDDGTIIVQSKTWEENLVKLKSAYTTVFQLTAALGLVLEHEKSEAFHFSRKHEDLNPPVDLGYAPHTGNTPLVPNKVWRYLGIFFDRKLLFKEHSKRYACKALSATRAMLFLGNSARGLKPKHKRLLYRSCIMPIALYGIRLWYYDGARIKGTMKELTKIQRQAGIWILGAFKSTPTGAVESLADLIPIHLQIRKLVYRNHVHMHMLADSHITHLMVATGNEADFISMYHPSQLRNKCKSPLVDMWANENLVDMFVLPYNKYNALGYRLTDTCPDRIIQDIVLIQGKTAKDRAKARETRLMTLNQSFARSSTSDSCIAIVTDACIPLLSTGYQAVAAWHIWHSDHYSENFRSGGLATSNDAETNAIGGALKALSGIFDSISDIDEIHICVTPHVGSVHPLCTAICARITWRPLPLDGRERQP